MVNLLFVGIGVWGPNVPVGWGFDIINFVWWIGIGHAGTLISAILLLLRQAVAHLDQPLRRGHDAVRGVLRGLLPDLPHRPALARVYWLFPYPNTMGLWPQLPQPAHLGRVRGLAPTPRCRRCSGTSA